MTKFVSKHKLFKPFRKFAENFIQEFLNISICNYPGFFITESIRNGLVFGKNIQLADIFY